MYSFITEKEGYLIPLEYSRFCRFAHTGVKCEKKKCLRYLSHSLYCSCCRYPQNTMYGSRVCACERFLLSEICRLLGPTCEMGLCLHNTSNERKEEIEKEIVTVIYD